jgi:Cell division protein 48 (CDC48), domain 2
MNRFVAVSLLVMGGIGVLSASDTPAIQGSTKSSFKMEGNRNPFWPIGWKPSAHGESQIPDTAFVVTSITLAKEGHYAIMNGKILQEGQQFAMQLGSQKYQLKVKAIEDGQIVLISDDQEITVPLRRK